MYRIGQSVDIHQLVENRKLILGGVEVSYDKGLLGHSDADVLLHAVIEAIIGAMGLGDIGKHFSDQDAQYKGISSMVLLDKTYQMMIEHGFCIENIDSIIMIEKPKLAQYIPLMVKNIASILHCNESQVNVKATRGEGLGFVGQGLGVQSQCVVLLKKKENINE